MNFKSLNFLIFVAVFWSPCESTFSHIFGDQSRKILLLPDLKPSEGEYRSVFYHEDTMAVVDVDSTNHLVGCEVIDIKSTKIEDPDNVLESLLVDKIEIAMSEMLGLMKQCDELDYDPSFTHNFFKKLVKLPWIIINAPIKIWHGLYPGTNWCGKGDIAVSYHDVGQKRDLDRCCRSHDLCPEKVEANSVSYGIKNNDPMTKSHCECDKIFYNCLNKVGGIPAMHVRMKYFDWIRPECVDDDLSTGTKTIRKFSLDRFKED